MANYKRTKPKEYRHVDCCIMESWHDSGNSRWRVPIKDLKKPQMNLHYRAAHRYKNVPIEWRNENS